MIKFVSAVLVCVTLSGCGIDNLDQRLGLSQPAVVNTVIDAYTLNYVIRDLRRK